MSSLKSLIDEVLYEQKEKTLKLFYKVAIFVQDFPEKEKEQEEPAPEEPETTPAPQDTTNTEVQNAPEPAETDPKTGLVNAPVESTTPKGKVLNEEIYKNKAEGELVIVKNDVENIQTLEDLLDYVSDLKSKEGKNVINQLVIEIVLAIAGAGQKSIEEVINKGDKVLIDIDYGYDRDDSVGLKVNKLAGSDTATITMKKDGKILAGQFNTALFNKQLLYYRNSLVA